MRSLPVALVVVLLAQGGCRTRLLDAGEGESIVDLRQEQIDLSSPEMPPMIDAAVIDAAGIDGAVDPCRGRPGPGAIGGCLPWRVGWDVFTEPIDLRASYAAWTVDPLTRTVAVDLHIAGGRPGTTHIVGMDYFPAQPKCLGSFGQASDHGVCLIPASRNGITVPCVEVFDLPSMTIDGAGNGQFNYSFKGVAPGSYPFAFHIRVGDYGSVVGGHPCPDCDVQYQAPGPFAGTTTIVIP